jgi:hypothetical protein
MLLKHEQIIIKTLTSHISRKTKKRIVCIKIRGLGTIKSHANKKKVKYYLKHNKKNNEKQRIKRIFSDKNLLF